MNSFLGKYIYLAGVRVRNDAIWSHYNFLIDSQNWELQKLQDYQLERLKDLLQLAYTKCSYYRKKFENSNIEPSMIKQLSDLERIPILTKDELLKNNDTIQIQSYPEKLFYSETSGSTGRPLVFYRNKDWDAWHRASVYRGYSWYGVFPWERNGYLWGYNFSLTKRLKTKLLDYLQNRFRLFSYKGQEINVFLKKLKKATFLGGYSSMIYELAKRINAQGQKFDLNLKLVKGTSEKIFDIYQQESLRAFGKRITSEYGAAETGIIAFECPQGNMHINMETVIVEEANHEIIVTNLVSRSFPIIRYKLGDYVEIDRQTRCRCGMAHPIIKDVIGRVGKVIYGINDQYPSLTLYYVFKNLAICHGIILNYQATQRKRGELEVAIENELDDTSRILLEKEFHKYFDNDINIILLDRSDLKSICKKKVDFVSDLSISTPNSITQAGSV